MTSASKPYSPPFRLTSEMILRVAKVAETVGRLTADEDRQMSLQLRRINRIRTIQGSLAIEGNTLSTEQITAILEGKRVKAPPREILEAINAAKAYERLADWDANREEDLLEAHGVMMNDLIEEAGTWRRGGVGVMDGDRVIHMAPPANRVPVLMGQLFEWLQSTSEHALIAGSVFHYEFEFIHPFADGNGRIGRLWQTRILSDWNPLMALLPVESLIYRHQSRYYEALQRSTETTDSGPFIEFMLSMIHSALDDWLTPQVAPQVTPQVEKLIQTLSGVLTRQEIQEKLGLEDRKSFRKRYLLPAIEAGLVEMTKPETPNSRQQRYRLTPAGVAFRNTSRSHR